MLANAAVYGCQGTELAPEDRAFFRDARPFGFILLGDQSQYRKPLPGRRVMRAIAGTQSAMRSAPIFIDQEGGRVQRLKPPHWQNRPAARRFGELFDRHPDQGREAAYLCARLIAHDLRSVGVTVNCAPVLDVPIQGAHDIIGDRAYSFDPATVIELGRATIEGYLDGGVIPVIKHMPGHGRAMADSHLALPRVATPLATASAEKTGSRVERANLNRLAEDIALLIGHGASARKELLRTGHAHDGGRGTEQVYRLGRYANVCTITGPAIAVTGPDSRGPRFCSIQASARLLDSSAAS